MSRMLKCNKNVKISDKIFMKLKCEKRLQAAETLVFTYFITF